MVAGKGLLSLWQTYPQQSDISGSLHSNGVGCHPQVWLNSGCDENFILQNWNPYVFWTTISISNSNKTCHVCFIGDIIALGLTHWPSSS